MSARFILNSGFELFVRQTRTRFPFRYGIASMTEVPHQFIRVSIRCGDRESTGLAAEGLPPKWFTKDPTSTFERDLIDMMAVIRHAARQAETIGREPLNFFEFSRRLDQEQGRWAEKEGHPPLLAGLGVSLCERAVLDALCRSLDRPLHQLIRGNDLGLCLGEAHPELRDAVASDLLPAQPKAECHVRHTVGLGDPLTPGDIVESERVEDGLPQDLDTSVKTYGLRYFKIKLSGRLAEDRARLGAIDRLLTLAGPSDWWATLDGNEQFKEMAEFRAFWEELVRSAQLRPVWRHVLLVEQPVHRDHALTDQAGAVLQSWPDRPPMIIDESDGTMGDLERALALGYAGTSHKNCKGIVKGLAHACLLAHRKRSGQPVVFTGEDLCNLGPVARLQDLAMMALLGIEHVERNGHHYYRGLSMWPAEQQEIVLGAHPDIYHRRPEGFVAVNIQNGMLRLGSVNRSPFGLGPLLDPVLMGATPNRSTLAAGE